MTATALRHPYINAWSDEHTPQSLVALDGLEPIP